MLMQIIADKVLDHSEKSGPASIAMNMGGGSMAAALAAAGAQGVARSADLSGGAHTGADHTALVAERMTTPAAVGESLERGSRSV